MRPRSRSALSDTGNLSVLLDQQEELKSKVTEAEQGLHVDTTSLKDSLYATIQQLRKQNTDMRREMDMLSRATTREIALRTAAESAAQDVITTLLANPDMMEGDNLTPEFVQTLAEAVKTAMFERDTARAELKDVSRQRDEAVAQTRELLSNGPDGPEALVREQIRQLQEDRAKMLSDRIAMMEEELGQARQEGLEAARQLGEATKERDEADETAKDLRRQLLRLQGREASTRQQPHVPSTAPGPAVTGVEALVDQPVAGPAPELAERSSAAPPVSPPSVLPATASPTPSSPVNAGSQSVLEPRDSAAKRELLHLRRELATQVARAKASHDVSATPAVASLADRPAPAPAGSLGVSMASLSVSDIHPQLGVPATTDTAARWPREDPDSVQGHLAQALRQRNEAVRMLQSSMEETAAMEEQLASSQRAVQSLTDGVDSRGAINSHLQDAANYLRGFCRQLEQRIELLSTECSRLMTTNEDLTMQVGERDDLVDVARMELARLHAERPALLRALPEDAGDTVQVMRAQQGERDA